MQAALAKKPDEKKRSEATQEPPKSSLGTKQGSGATPGLPLFLQAKLAISQPNDPYEQEADRVADQIMQMPVEGGKPAIQKSVNSGNTFQRACDSSDMEGDTIQQRPLPSQRSPAARTSAHIHNAIASGGIPLDHQIRSFFEPRLGYDLGSVRIHVGEAAAESSRMLDAKAYTVGNNIIFGSQEYRLETTSGKHLLAHELTHTLQQDTHSSTIHRKIEVESGVELKRFNDTLTKTGNVYSYSEPVRDKALDFEILTSLLSSPRTFKLKANSNDKAEKALIDHINAREGVVRFAKEKRYKFAAGQAGFHMNEKYWEWGGGKFKSKPGVNLDEARKDLNVHPEEYTIGCSAATQLTVKAGAGSESFADTTSDPKDWVPGESGFIQNPGWDGGDNGLQGENIIYMGGKRFWGHFRNDNAIEPYKVWFERVKSWNNAEPTLSGDRTYPTKGLKI